MQSGTLGGRFTTLEGILEQVYEELSEKAFAGDSVTQDQRKFEDFLADLKAVRDICQISEIQINSFFNRSKTPNDHLR